MTIAERINLHRCGYSRAEIDALAKEEKEAKAAEEPAPAQDTTTAEEPAPEPAPTQDTKGAEETAPDPVLEAIKGLTAAIQASNINKTPQPEAKPETVTDLLKNL